MKKFKLITGCLLAILAINQGIPIRVKTIWHTDRYIICEYWWL